MGPYLDPRKMAEQVPDKFGSGLIHKVVRESVQKLVDVSLDQKAVFGMLRQGEGKVIITASFEDKIQKVRLPAMDNENSVTDFLEILFEELRCEPFYQVFKADNYDPEDEPLKNGKRKNEVTLTFSNAMPTLTASVDSADTAAGPSYATPKLPRLSSIDPASFYNGKLHKSNKTNMPGNIQRGRGRPPGAKNKTEQGAKSKTIPTSPSKSTKTGPIYQNAHKLHLAQEKAKALAAAAASFSSDAPVLPLPRLEPEELPKDATLWTIDNVISHLGRLDPTLRPHVDMFRSHEIDGNALLLLTSDMMMKYMGMKLGPALKICNIINMIQGKKHQPLPM